MVDSYTFDFDLWRHKIPWESIDGTYRRGAGACCSPQTILATEYLRELAAKKRDLGRRVPADVFVMGCGEAPLRDMSQIGGCPYRPANLRWPETELGPMTFLAQFRFSDSRDLVGELPGDLLVLFAKDETACYGERGDLHWEWYPLGLTNLVSPQDVPEPDWRFINCYGLRHRTVDYVDVESVMKCVKEFTPKTRDLNEYAWVGEFLAASVARWWGMKIGGAHPWVPTYENTKVNLPGKPLAQLAAFAIGWDEEYPCINRVEPRSIDDDYREWSLTWLDTTRSLFISMDERGELHWTFVEA